MASPKSSVKWVYLQHWTQSRAGWHARRHARTPNIRRYLWSMNPFTLILKTYYYLFHSQLFFCPTTNLKFHIGYVTSIVSRFNPCPSLSKLPCSSSVQPSLCPWGRTPHFPSLQGQFTPKFYQFYLQDPTEIDPLLTFSSHASLHANNPCGQQKSTTSGVGTALSSKHRFLRIKMQTCHCLAQHCLALS